MCVHNDVCKISGKQNAFPCMFRLNESADLLEHFAGSFLEMVFEYWFQHFRGMLQLVLWRSLHSREVDNAHAKVGPVCAQAKSE